MGVVRAIGTDVVDLDHFESVVTRCDAFLLRNHGAMTVGDTVLTAYHKLETVEHFAHISFIARHLGSVSPLAGEEVRKLYALRRSMGATGVYTGCEEAGVCGIPEASDEKQLVKIIVEEVVKILREGRNAVD